MREQKDELVPPREMPRSIVQTKLAKHNEMWCSLGVGEVLHRRALAREAGELVELDSWVGRSQTFKPVFVHPDDVRSVEAYE